MHKFSTGILWRVIFIAAMALAIAFSFSKNNTLYTILIGACFAYSVYNLYIYTTSINKKLSRIFDSIQYQDFAITFRADNVKGDSFEQLNNSLNAVIKSFNQIRAEREATLHFIQAIIQQINVGILSYNNDGKIELINQAANKILSIYKLSHISSIKNPYKDIYEAITTLPSGDSKLVKINSDEISISVKEIILRDRKLRLIALHNIRSELQARELEAWQNLTKVLRHEILNTVTPIVSLTETMKSIIDIDLVDVEKEKHKEGVSDLKQAVHTVIHRSKGIMNFVNAYREFTSIPLPNLSEVKASEILSEVEALYEKSSNVAISFEVLNDFTILCDIDQVQQVMINLIKNSIEATEQLNEPCIKVTSLVDGGIKTITVSDNGQGINQDDFEKIFVPFYTSKSAGSGIGLSLSRQIMFMHNGLIECKQAHDGGALFFIRF
jgi:two-component system, NtrC family, nitrogen regulation sensor histidine kinase NtrY